MLLSAYLSIHLSIQLSLHRSIHPSIHPSMDSSSDLCFYQSVYLSNSPFIHISIDPYFLQYICPFILLSNIYLSIYPFIHQPIAMSSLLSFHLFYIYNFISIYFAIHHALFFSPDLDKTRVSLSHLHVTTSWIPWTVTKLNIVHVQVSCIHLSYTIAY